MPISEPMAKTAQEAAKAWDQILKRYGNTDAMKAVEAWRERYVWPMGYQYTGAIVNRGKGKMSAEQAIGDFIETKRRKVAKYDQPEFGSAPVQVAKPKARKPRAKPKAVPQEHLEASAMNPTPAEGVNQPTS